MGLIADESQHQALIQAAFSSMRSRVDYADLLYERVAKTELMREPDRLLTTPYTVKARVQLRLLKEGKKVEVKIGELGREALNAGLEQGLKLLELTPVLEPPVRLAPIPNPGRQSYGRQPKIDLRQIDPSLMTDGVLRGLEEMVKRLSDRYPDVRISPEIWFFSQIEEKLICDLFGVRKDQTIPRTFIQVLTKVRDERGRSAQTRVRLGEVLGPEFLGSLDDKGYKLKSGVREQLAHWMELAMKLLDAQTISPEELAQLDHLILDRSALGVFVHEALGHNFEADIIKAGNSGVVDREGRPRGEVASEMVHIVDGPLLDPAGSPNFDQGFGTEFIDDEGVEVIPKFLARNGRVSDFILNRETAAHYNRAPNGGAFSELGDPRLPRMSNTYILPADHSVWYNSLEELLKDVRQGIILIGTLGGAVGRDGMSSSVQLGYRVKDGKLQELIKPANFSAQTLYALRYVDGFAGKLGVDDIGFCGKGGQSKPVGDGGPEFTRIAANPYVSVTIQG